MEALGQFEGKSLIVGDVTRGGHIRHKLVFFDIDGENVSSSVDDDHSIGGCVPGGDETELVGDLLSRQEGGGRNLIHEEVSHFGDDE